MTDPRRSEGGKGTARHLSLNFSLGARPPLSTSSPQPGVPSICNGTSEPSHSLNNVSKCRIAYTYSNYKICHGLLSPLHITKLPAMQRISIFNRTMLFVRASKTSTTFSPSIPSHRLRGRSASALGVEDQGDNKTAAYQQGNELAG